MKRIFTIAIIVLSTLSTGCKKWLDVKPEDKFIEDEVFKNPQGFIDALNGIYLDLGSTDMYGFELTMGTMDLLAQYYNISPTHSVIRQQLQVYNYEDVSARAQTDRLWTKMYKSILSINSLLGNLETKGGVLDANTLSIFKGEALALRAYLYLDLLRMYTPAYAIDPNAKLIPYYSKADNVAAPFQSSTYVADRILEDLAMAEGLLGKVDPALTDSKIDKTTGLVNIGVKPYLTYRNYHMNYYAVLALKARTFLWLGQKDKALAAAEQVIAIKGKFPWITADQVNNTSSPNLVFSPEIIFAFENPKLYDNYNANFSAALRPESMLYAGSSNSFLSNIYDNWELDYRYKSMWKPDGDKVFSVFVKYKDLLSPGGMNFRYTVSGIRLSEVFLIAAECESNSTKALAYINEIREHRNCLPIGTTTDLQGDILKETRREFYGEGQLWYFYKRKQISNIFSATGLRDVSLEAKNYVFPLPLSETEPR